jgi:23S rRNA (cytosine1962-C5)-methyltransferase
MNLILSHEKARLMSRYRHPWLYRGAILEMEGETENGALAAVMDEDRRVIAHGFYSTASKIACRVLCWGEGEPAPDWVKQRLTAARRLRLSLNIPSNAYRLINAEGDFFPGLILDLYGTTAVLRPQIRGVERLAPEITAALADLIPGISVYLKRDERAARVEGLECAGGYLAGGGSEPVIIEEAGVTFQVDVREGQKTGFYLDQRDNRARVRSVAAGRTVLNLFSYTGAFALQALAGGAAAVDSVDSSPGALRIAERNYGLNGFAASAGARWIRADGFDFLDRSGAYDLIILDPPPFARTRGEVPGALRGYRRLQVQALRRLSPGGLLFTFSCSGAVDEPAFRRVLFEAALETGRPVRVISALRAAPDHPCSLLHPEGEYLKGIMAYVE